MYRVFSFFCMYVHALTCRHPCQRGGARGSHARVDLGDLLTARMSGAGCAGSSIMPHAQPALGRRPSPLPEPQLQPQPPRANLQTVPSGACVQHLLARIVGCSVAHQRARPPCARQHIAWSRRWGMRLGLWLGLGLRMRRRCGDGGGGAAIGCRRLPSATRPAAERPAELWASGIPSLLTVGLRHPQNHHDFDLDSDSTLLHVFAKFPEFQGTGASPRLPGQAAACGWMPCSTSRSLRED